MGGQILDVEGENFLVFETLLEQRVHIRNIDLLFDLQFVMVGEVERQRHVRLPHAALHVVHGQGVGGLVFQGFGGALLIERDRLAVVFDGFGCFAGPITLVDHGIILVGVLVGADVGGYGVVRAKFQQTGRFTVRAADIQHQLAVNVDPHVIVAGEEELDRNFNVLAAGVFSYNNLAVLCKRKVKLQLGAKAVVVLGCPDCADCLVKREKAVGAIGTVW